MLVAIAIVKPVAATLRYTLRRKLAVAPMLRGLCRREVVRAQHLHLHLHLHQL